MFEMRKRERNAHDTFINASKIKKYCISVADSSNNTGYNTTADVP